MCQPELRGVSTGAEGCVNASPSTLALVLKQAVDAVGSTGGAPGLDVGSAGLFWLRGTGLREHAELAASSKGIGESRELN